MAAYCAPDAIDDMHKVVLEVGVAAPFEATCTRFFNVDRDSRPRRHV